MPYTKSFLDLFDSIEKEYLGKPVPKKYRKKYGKYYDFPEIKLLAFAIAKSKKIKIHYEN